MYRHNDSVEILEVRYQLHKSRDTLEAVVVVVSCSSDMSSLVSAVVWTACAKFGENQPTLTDTCYPLKLLQSSKKTLTLNRDYRLGASEKKSYY